MNRTMKYAINTALSIIMIIAICVIVVVFSKNNHKRYDLTKEKRFSLSAQSIKILKNLDKDVEVIVFHSKGGSFEQEARALMDQYEYHSKKFKAIYLETNKNPFDARKYRLSSTDAIIVKLKGDGNDKEGPGRFETVTRADESDLTNALIKISQKSTPTVYFVTGHGERTIDGQKQDGYAQAVQGLKEQSYTIKSINLSREEKVPDDCDLLIIAGPKTTFFPAEVDRIKTYVNNGGAMMLLFEPRRSNDELVTFLNEKGIQVNNDIIIDQVARQLGGQYFMPVVLKYGKSPITRDFRLMTIFPFSRSLKILEKAPAGVKWTSFAGTTKQSWGETSTPRKGDKIQFDRDVDFPGPLTIGAAGTVQVQVDPDASPEKKETDKKKKSDSRMVVFGCVEFAANQFYAQQGNGNLFMNSVSWLTAQENLIAIAPKKAGFTPLFLRKEDELRMKLIIFLPPLIILATGISLIFFNVRKRKNS